MTHLKQFIYSPGGENESGNKPSNDTEDQKDNIEKPSETKEEGKEHKTVMEKIKEALHDWSNKDERDQEFDDTRV